MKKDSVLFKRVAAVIGEEKAVIELGKVIDKGVTIDWHGGILMAFRWKGAPQGVDFWARVNMGMNPYE